MIRRSFAAAALVLAAPLLSPATALAQASKDKPTPATAMEVNTYGVMSIATFCEATVSYTHLTLPTIYSV